MKKSGSRPVIDTSEFARRKEVLSGETALNLLPRLGEYLSDMNGQVQWSLAGRRHVRPDGGAELFLNLELAAALRMDCVRCLQAVEVQIDENRSFKLAVTESQAEREDRDAEEFDVLAGSDQFDVLDLVEDEAIMALPIAPRHEHCSAPQQRGIDAAIDAMDDTPVRENPFAMLARLKRREGDDET